MYACNGIWTAFSDELPPDDAYDEGTLTPLYTHPAKTLTDEEILKVIKKHESINGNIDTYDVLACVKEILRKAQEK